MLVLALLAPVSAFADQFFASTVIDYQKGTPRQAGFLDPAFALGGPRGGGAGQQSFHVVNLGVGGSLTLGFDGTTGQGDPITRTIADRPGPDFIVFENAFYAGDGADATKSFAELMFVEVSSDGVNFARFPTSSNTPKPDAPDSGLTINPADVSGFGGVHPVFANTAPSGGNAINPYDPAVAGGDAFDLATLSGAPGVNLNAIRYVRMVDVLGDGTVLDSAGHPIYDATGDPNGGADVDAIAVINGDVALPEPAAIGIPGISAIMMLARRRSRSGSLSRRTGRGSRDRAHESVT